jgi:hypothetical protein
MQSWVYSLKIISCWKTITDASVSLLIHRELGFYCPGSLSTVIWVAIPLV